MTVNAYLGSDFAEGMWCTNQANAIARDMAHSLTHSPRIFVPFIGLKTLVAVLVLRVASLVEPIIGIVADLTLALCFRSSKPLANIMTHMISGIVCLPLNLCFIVRDIALIGFKASLYGIIDPQGAVSKFGSIYQNED